MGDINPYRLKVSQLRALVAIADTGTFIQAALALDLSQSSISHAIATLEEELGVVLLNRGNQGTTLTPLGEDITAEARQVLQHLETITQKAQTARGGEQGQVRVAIFRSMATHVLPEVIQQLRSTHPGLQVVIEESPYFSAVDEAVRQGRADIGFTYLPASKEFESWELLRDRYLVLMPPTTPAVGPLTWDDLQQYPLILPPVIDGCRMLIDRYFKAIGRPIPPTYEVKEDSTALGMVQRGLGITIMAKLAAEPIPPSIQVAELAVPLERIIGVIQRADALLPPPVYAFMDALKQVWQQSGLTLDLVPVQP
ncbi:MAG: LysR family transcriptional regulator [Cyanobacteria bacterium]|nr:LysR family transcriptional regulator [Cyanobacteriota bacterium]